MANQSAPTWTTITAHQFQQALEAYEPLIQSISDTKGAKNGQSPLLELDHYRYGKAVDLFSQAKDRTQMTLKDVEKLVEWKLRHGQYRPTLMKLVQSNDPEGIQEIARDAITTYREDGNVAAAIELLSKPRGIGPATASLLLAVHDPEKVVFFADEAYYWLCCEGQKGTIKYTAKEYLALGTRAKQLAARLGVRAVDIERVAFVIMRDPSFTAASASGKPSKGVSAVRTKPTPTRTEAKPTKRKKSSEISAVETTSLRRSKRSKST